MKPIDAFSFNSARASLPHSHILSLAHSFSRSLTLTQSFSLLLAHSLTHSRSLVHSPSLSLVHSLTCSLILSLTRSLSQSFTLLLVHCLTHSPSLVHSLTLPCSLSCSLFFTLSLTYSFTLSLSLAHPLIRYFRQMQEMIKKEMEVKCLQSQCTVARSSATTRPCSVRCCRCCCYSASNKQKTVRCRKLLRRKLPLPL